MRVVLAAVIVVAMVALGSLNLVRTEREADSAVRPSSTVLADQPDGALTMEAAYPAALARASEWDEQPRLVFASLQADWPLDQQIPGPPEFAPGGWVRFAFTGQSGSDGGLLSIVIERYSGEIVTAESQAWDARATDPVPVGQTVVTSDRAVLEAERERGQSFRLACPIERHEADVTLLRGPTTVTPGDTSASGLATPVAGAVVGATPVPAGSTAIWLVTYRQATQPGTNSLEIEIDATTGAIIAVRDQSQGCGGLAG